MPIQLQCPSCGGVLQAPDHLQGQAVACPKCRQAVGVPHVAAPVAQQPSAANQLDQLEQLAAGSAGMGYQGGFDRKRSARLINILSACALILLAGGVVFIVFMTRKDEQANNADADEKGAIADGESLDGNAPDGENQLGSGEGANNQNQQANTPDLGNNSTGGNSSPFGNGLSGGNNTGGPTPRNNQSTIGGASFAAMPYSGPVVPDALVPVPLSQNVAVQLASRGFGSSLSKVLLSSNRSLALVVSGGMGPTSTWLELVDLTKNQHIGGMSFPDSEAKLFGITSDDQGLFSLSETSFTGPDKVVQWTLNNGQIQKRREILLTDSSFKFMESCHVINDDTIYVKTFKEYQLVDMATGRTLFREDCHHLASVAFSANEKYAALQAETDSSGDQPVYIVDCDRLTLAGTFQAPQMRSMQFSENGRLLAGLAGKDLLLYDVTSGRLAKRVPFPKAPDSMRWCTDDLIIAGIDTKPLGQGKVFVIGVQKGCPIGQLDDPRLRLERDQILAMLGVSLGGGNFFRVTSGLGSSNAIVVSTFQPPIGQWVNSNANPNDYYVMLTGNPVSFEVLNSPRVISDEQVSTLNLALSDIISDVGGQLAEQSEIRVVCHVKPGPIGSDGRGGRPQTVDFEINVYRGDELLGRRKHNVHRDSQGAVTVPRTLYGLDDFYVIPSAWGIALDLGD